MITASIVGASGYVGGELIRLLINHPEVQIQQITSERFAGKRVKTVHPTLRDVNLKFCPMNELEKCDLLFVSLQHGKVQEYIHQFMQIADKIIDLSADFRISEKLYNEWYDSHSSPELLPQFVYGIPELFRDQIRESNLVSSAGCNATASILALYPLIAEGILQTNNLIVDVKVGSSEAGNKFSFASHHPERVRSLRSYKPTKHRHTAEILHILGQYAEDLSVNMSATSVDTVRGVLATIHTFLQSDNITEKDIWKIYRKYYGNERFIRIIKEKSGNFRYPDPKILLASNYCDIGFEKDGNRLVIISAIDNLMKGAAGQAVQAMNIMFGFAEDESLRFPGIHLY